MLVPCDLWEIFDTWQPKGHSTVSVDHGKGQGVTQESRGEQLWCYVPDKDGSSGRRKWNKGRDAIPLRSVWSFLLS